MALISKRIISIDLKILFLNDMSLLDKEKEISVSSGTFRTYKIFYHWLTKTKTKLKIALFLGKGGLLETVCLMITNIVFFRRVFVIP